MASTVPIAPPEQFDFNKPDEWPRWKNRFQQFLSASGLDKEVDERRVSTLLYCLNTDTDNVLTLRMTTERSTQNSYRNSTLTSRSNATWYFSVLNSTNLKVESAKRYIMALYSLVKRCDMALSRRKCYKIDCLLASTTQRCLKLSRWMWIWLSTNPKCHLAERSHERTDSAAAHSGQQECWRGQDSRPQRSKNAHKQHSHHAHRDPEIRGVVLKGKQTAPGDRCPAKGAICRKCNRKGHYAAACFSKTVATSAHELEAEDPAWMGAVTGNSDTSHPENSQEENPIQAGHGSRGDCDFRDHLPQAG